jgi:RNA polymerase sigma-70 factor (ECF subfamily)
LASRADLIKTQLAFLRIRRGETAAFEDLVDLWQRPLLYYLRRLVGSEDDAWDVLQDTWLQVVRRIGQLRQPERFPAWIYQIARNAAATHHRRLKVFDPLPEDGQEPSTPPSQPDELIAAADARTVHQALDRLSPAHREVLTLFFLEGFSQRDIGEITGLPAGTVKSRVFHAKRALRTILEKEGFVHA